MTDTPNNSALPPPLPADATAAQAGERLALLSSNKEWAARLLASDVATRNEFQQLTEKIAAADRTAEALEGAPSVPAFEPNVDGVSRQDLSKAVGWLQQDGIPDGVIVDIVNGKEVSAKDHESVRRYWARCRADTGWINRLTSGDPEARRDFVLATAVLAANVKDAAA
jgi:hypothetical protein